MLKSRNDSFIPFASGLMAVLKVERMGRIIKDAVPVLVPFEDQTVGYKRFFTASQVGVCVDRAVLVDLQTAVKRGQIVELVCHRTGEPEFYRVEQIQERADSKPPSLLLSLSEIKTAPENDERKPENTVKGAST